MQIICWMVSGLVSTIDLVYNESLFYTYRRIMPQIGRQSYVPSLKSSFILLIINHFSGKLLDDDHKKPLQLGIFLVVFIVLHQLGQHRNLNNPRLKNAFVPLRMLNDIVLGGEYVADNTIGLTFDFFKSLLIEESPVNNNERSEINASANDVKSKKIQIDDYPGINKSMGQVNNCTLKQFNNDSLCRSTSSKNFPHILYKNSYTFAYPFNHLWCVIKASSSQELMQLSSSQENALHLFLKDSVLFKPSEVESNDIVCCNLYDSYKFYALNASTKNEVGNQLIHLKKHFFTYVDTEKYSALIGPYIYHTIKYFFKSLESNQKRCETLCAKNNEGKTPLNYAISSIDRYSVKANRALAIKAVAEMVNELLNDENIQLVDKLFMLSSYDSKNTTSVMMQMMQSQDPELWLEDIFLTFIELMAIGTHQGHNLLSHPESLRWFQSFFANDKLLNSQLNSMLTWILTKASNEVQKFLLFNLSLERQSLLHCLFNNPNISNQQLREVQEIVYQHSPAAVYNALNTRKPSLLSIVFLNTKNIESEIIRHRIMCAVNLYSMAVPSCQASPKLIKEHALDVLKNLMINENSTQSIALIEQLFNCLTMDEWYDLLIDRKSCGLSSEIAEVLKSRQANHDGLTISQFILPYKLVGIFAYLKKYQRKVDESSWWHDKATQKNQLNDFKQRIACWIADRDAAKELSITNLSTQYLSLINVCQILPSSSSQERSIRNEAMFGYLQSKINEAIDPTSKQPPTFFEQICGEILKNLSNTGGFFENANEQMVIPQVVVEYVDVEPTAPNW